MINIKEDAKLSVMNHSCAHLMAQAVKHLYPDALFWVGPVIEEGFYYDIDLNGKTLNEEDLPAIEKEMKKLAKDGKRIVRHEISKEEALELSKDIKQETSDLLLDNCIFEVNIADKDLSPTGIDDVQ